MLIQFRLACNSNLNKPCRPLADGGGLLLVNGYNLGHVGFDYGSFELLVLYLGSDLGLSVEHG